MSTEIGQQRKPKPRPRRAAAPPDLSVGALIGRVRARLMLGLDAELEPLRLTGAQYAILRQIAGGCVGSAADLCRTLSYDTGSMTRMLGRLEQRGVIRRMRSKGDRRIVNLKLAAAGRALMPRLKVASGRVVKRQLAGFSDVEISVLQALLLRMIDNA